MKLGVIMLRTNRPYIGIPHAMVAREVGGHNRDPWLLLGKCFIMGGIDRPHDAEPCLRKAMEMHRDADVLMCLGECLYQLKRFDEARVYFKQTWEADRENTVVLERWANLELDAKNPEAALEVIRMSPWEKRRNQDLLVLETEIRMKMGASNAQVLGAVRSISDDRLTPVAISSKGNIYDKLGCYEDAWECWKAGKAGARPYDREGAEQYIKVRRDYFAGRELVKAERGEGGQPIFIVGAPRSGTTLVEQMLSAHPDIEAGGELKLMQDMLYLIPRFMGLSGEYPEATSDFSVGDMNNLRDAYLKEASRRGLRREKAWFTDKQLVNVYDIPFIHALFPESPVFYIVRHPVDVVLSQFSTHMSHNMWAGSSPEDAAHHIKITHEYVKEDDLIPYKYEEIISDPEWEMGEMCEEIKIPFDERMLSPHTNTNISQTASRLQVQEPIHDRSIGRWKNYRQWLGPAIEILRDTCNELGYEI